MAKRRAEECLLYESPSKRCCARLSRVDIPLDSMAPTGGGVSPPALLALLDSRCRKRSHYPEAPDSQVETRTALHGKAVHCDARENINVESVHTSGSFQKRPVSPGPDTNPSKRPRSDSKSSETDIRGAADEGDKEQNTEDFIYNSFQYWRLPLPQLDLSLLESGSDDPQTKGTSKLKDSSYDAMET
ncbi:uncharacterized protein C9orf40 [Salarias fasciatus]|uniref:uncharacterized protein C9orf40 n=1 Tax=Salarias fasciatus TaxID=181472 RepID=UPI001176AE87|nr:uncharacterized protein C9orf40 homolog [Salarias fasciatus]